MRRWIPSESLLVESAELIDALAAALLRPASPAAEPPAAERDAEALPPKPKGWSVGGGYLIITPRNDAELEHWREWLGQQYSAKRGA